MRKYSARTTRSRIGSDSTLALPSTNHLSNGCLFDLLQIADLGVAQARTKKCNDATALLDCQFWPTSHPRCRCIGWLVEESCHEKGRMTMCVQREIVFATCLRACLSPKPSCLCTNALKDCLSYYRSALALLGRASKALAMLKAVEHLCWLTFYKFYKNYDVTSHSSNFDLVAKFWQYASELMIFHKISLPLFACRQAVSFFSPAMSDAVALQHPPRMTASQPTPLLSDEFMTS